MKILSAFVSGLVLARPVLEIKALYENKARVVASIGLALAALGLFMTSFIVCIMEFVLQYDAQGFVLWSPMFTVAMVFFCIATAATFGAKAIFPKPQDAVAPQLQVLIHNVLQGMANQFPTSNEVPNTRGTRETERELSDVERERERLRQHPRGDINYDQLGTPAFTH